jgi:hypothetical protein
MPRIRTIKPDAFTSDSLSSVPRGTRWTFAGLWTYFDDEGRGRADPRLIEAALYPVDDNTTVRDVADDLDLLERIGAICRYIVEGRRFIHAPKWGHQKINRPTESRLPPCPKCDESLATHGGLSESVMSTSGLSSESDEYVASPQVTTDSVRAHGGLSDGSPPEKEKEQGKGSGKGTGKRNRDTSADADFDRFWLAYPKRVAKGQAKKAWPKAVEKADARTLTAAAEDYARWHQEQNTDPQFIKNPSTWLNGECWLDERPARKPQTTRVGEHLALVQQLEDEERRQIGPA